jgi:hypothetical protein
MNNKGRTAADSSYHIEIAEETIVTCGREQPRQQRPGAEMAAEEVAATAAAWIRDGGRRSDRDGGRRGLNNGGGRGGLKKLISLNPNPNPWLC